MNQKKRQQLACFGKLEQVFPKSKDGLRHTPEDCMQCLDKVECLRTAVSGDDGLTVKEEKLDRAYDSGQIGFLERWTRKKAIRQRKQRQKRLWRCLQLFKK